MHNESSLSRLTLLAVFFPLHEAVVPSSAGGQLLILLSAWGARPSFIPLTRVDPISLGFQATSCPSVGYNYSQRYHLKTLSLSSKLLFGFCILI
jgi:hypothetical protein